MSNKLNIRKLRRKNLAYGKYKYRIVLSRSHPRVYYSVKNGSDVHEIRSLLNSMTSGTYRFNREKNNRGQWIYTDLYLQDGMALAMLKLSFPNIMFKVYEIELDQQPSE